MRPARALDLRQSRPAAPIVSSAGLPADLMTSPAPGPEKTDARTLAVPTWFGDAARPLFGWLHQPRHEAVRGAVVLCPPVGIEHQSAYSSLRALADNLAEAGHLVLRFDYEGTGDSSGDLASIDGADAWQRSVAEAVSFARGLGQLRVTLVGLRIGALLAATAAVDVDALVVWDPCASGASFLRQQRALGAMTMGRTATAEGSVEAPWALWPAPIVSSLRRLSFDTVQVEPDVDVLLLTRDAEPDLAARLGARVTAQTTSEQERLFDQHPPAMPVDAMRAVTDWIVARAEPAAAAHPAEPAVRPAADIASPTGTTLTERALTLGPVGLFGILTERPGAVGPVVVLVAGSTDHHIGPGRLWVTLARRWAADGARVLRIDLSGMGDSGVRSGQSPLTPYAPEAADDLVAAAAAISPDDPAEVILVGFCSGAHAALEAGLRFAPRAVMALNPLAYFEAPASSAEVAVDAERKVRQERAPWMLWLARLPVGKWIRAHLPEIGWRVLDRLHVLRSPATGFSLLVKSGVRTMVVCSSADGDIYQRMSGRQIERLSATGRFTFVINDQLSHSLLSLEERETCAALMTKELRSALRLSSPRGTNGLTTQ